MLTNLKQLVSWLSYHGLHKEAQHLETVVEENPWLTNDPWDETWNEEAIKEFGENPISEEEYVEQNFSGTDKDLENIQDSENNRNGKLLKQL